MRSVVRYSPASLQDNFSAENFTKGDLDLPQVARHLPSRRFRT
jgi:hypothetical protein